MTTQQVRVSSFLLQEGYGDLVEKVGTYLMKHGPSPLAEVVKRTELKTNQVKKCLCVLIHHQLADFEAHKTGAFMLYRVTPGNVLLRVRFPRYIHASQLLFGDAGELIVEDILQQGQVLMSKRSIHLIIFPVEDWFSTLESTRSQLELNGGHNMLHLVLKITVKTSPWRKAWKRPLLSIQRVAERVAERLDGMDVQLTDVGQTVKDQFVALVEGHYLQRVRPPNPELVTISHSEEAGVSTIPVYRQFELPASINAITYRGRKRKRSDSTEEGEPTAKRARRERRSTEEKEEEETAVDDGIYWHVNYDRFQQYFRDQAIISATSNSINETAGCVMRTVLDVSSDLMQDSPPSATSSPEIYTMQIVKAMPEKPKLTGEELGQYLKVLVDDQAHFLNRTGDSGGGAYSVDFRHAAELLCKATIESIVRERFGSKCFRVFRLLLLKKVLEQKQVADMAMIPSKEAKEMLYSLMAESFVTLQEIPRTADYAPSRTFYLFSINLPHVARMVIERCYKALGNLIAKRVAEMKENKRLLDKFQQYEQQQQELQGGGEEEDVEVALTPDEKGRVERVKRSIEKLEHGELQLDETIMIISNYISTHSSSH